MSSWDKEWMMTFTGRRVYPFDLSVHDIDIRDIAHATALQCRYNGHTTRFYSVAEHMTHIANAIYKATGNRTVALQGLLHDAGEAYTGDFIRPVKNSLREMGDRLHEAEDRNEAIIAQAFGVPHPFDPIVKEFDRRIIVNERDTLFGPNKPWDWDLEPLDIAIVGYAPEIAELNYQATYGFLRS